MKFATRLATAAALLVTGVAAHAACVYPQAPQNIPNGATATKDQMLAAQAQIKEYSKAVQEVYLPCLETERKAAEAALDPGDPELAQKKLALQSMEAKKHNAALDELTAVAGRWSEEIKAFNNASKK
ncbi:MAG TPA: hypothetical protein PK163_09675 [Steroidobacteraceae bacterium]|nr:hypothetical protein [Steroidobacteraceae bacterium]